MKANSEKTKQSKKATRRVLAGVLCGASVLSLVLSLVMPPISQAIANDTPEDSTEETVTVGGSSTESTDVENTNNVDTENQNSDETEGDEAGDDSQPEEQPEEEQQSEGRTTSDGETVVTAAQNEQTEAAAVKITSAEELRDKLQAVKAGETASFELTRDIVYNDEIFLNKDGSNITLNLNGCKIMHSGGDRNLPLFSVSKDANASNGANLTIKDSIKDSKSVQETVADVGQLQDKGEALTTANYGKTAKMNYDTTSGIPTELTYYVTESTASDTGTTEKIYEHKATIQGAIVSTAPNGSTLRLINVYAGGKFNLQGGTLTQKKDCNVGSLIYAENGSTVNMSGGYVCGASTNTWANGAGVMVSNEGGDSASALNLTGGVIAGNCSSSGGGVYAKGSAVKVTGGVISGNSTLNMGLGGGIMAEGGTVTVSGGHITNNRMAKFCGTDGNGCHGGAGLAANSGARVTISGGQITGNYSDEAGGGVYVTNLKQQGKAWLNIKGGIIASNVSYRSEGAGIRVGQRVDAMINGPKDINGTKESIVYITNNHCMSRFDWGGGGIFVQGDSINAENAGRLFVYNSYISSNTAGGYGGGVAVCPSGKTLVTNTEGTAIFGNSSAGADYHDKKYPDPAYDKEHNSGNDKAPHLSKGGDGKNQDYTAYLEQVFRDNGHADFFLAAHDNNKPIAVVTGKMLGGGDARYTGSIELKKAINIPANGAVGVKNSIGLTSGVMSGVTAGDKAAIKARNDAQNEATTFITGNYSWDHGGGIMSNGDLCLGQPTDAYVYPSIKATKELIDSQTDGKKPLTANEFTFKVYRKGSQDPFANGTFDRGACIEVGNASNDANGNITFNLGEQSAPSSSAGEITYYLVEDAGNDPYIKYDSAVYEIVGTLKDNVTVLMSVPTLNDESKIKEISVHNYTLENARVIKHSGNSTNSPCALKDDGQGYYSIVNSDGSKTFTNTYTSSFSWIPKATKVVEGGEMKVFTLQLADNPMFDNAQEVKTQANGVNSQPLEFGNISYTLDDSTKGADSTGRSAPKDFPYYYYVCEKDESEKYPHYKFDHSVYRFEVYLTDVTNGTINYRVTYKKGTVDSEGNWTAEDNAEERTFIDTSAPNSTPTFTPTFINTYSTSLPLSGMSGVTLTYLAGAAVLCAAAAWMHIRRKANAKGGKRRE